MLIYSFQAIRLAYRFILGILLQANIQSENIETILFSKFRCDHETSYWW